MASPADIRDETCTNLSILLKLLIRNIKSGESVSLITTKKQLLVIEELFADHGINVRHSPHPDGFLVIATRS